MQSNFRKTPLKLLRKGMLRWLLYAFFLAMKPFSHFSFYHFDRLHFIFIDN